MAPVKETGRRFELEDLRGRAFLLAKVVCAFRAQFQSTSH